MIEGLALVGKTLTVHPGVWGPVGVRTTVRWYADGVLLTRAMGDTVVLSGAEAGKLIRVRVSGELEGYADRIIDSLAVGPVVSRER